MSLVTMMASTDSLANHKVEYTLLNEPRQVRALLLKERCDFAFLPMNMAAILYNKGLPYQLAMVPVWGTLYLCGSDETVKNVGDLKGKRVHLMARGMNPDLIFRFLLKENGIDPDSDLNLDYSFPSHIDLANAVNADIAKLAVLSEPQLSLVKHKNPKIHTLIDLNALWESVTGFAIPQTALVVHSAQAKQNPLLVNAFIDRLQATVKEANSFPLKTAHQVVEYTILPDAAVAQQAWPACHINPLTVWDSMDALNKYLEVFYTFNPVTIGGQIPDEGFILKK